MKHSGKYQLVEIDEDDDGSGGGDALLGKLSEKQINKGQKVLEQIRAILESGKKADLTELSGSYYSFIPTQSGMKQPPKIADFNILQEISIRMTINVKVLFIISNILQEKENLLEFWLRMGFEELGEETSENPLAGVKDRPIPATLQEATNHPNPLQEGNE